MVARKLAIQAKVLMVDMLKMWYYFSTLHLFEAFILKKNILLSISVLDGLIKIDRISHKKEIQKG